MCAGDCAAALRRDALADHAALVCAKRRVTCRFCEERVPLDRMRAHLDEAATVHLGALLQRVEAGEADLRASRGALAQLRTRVDVLESDAKRRSTDKRVVLRVGSKFFRVTPLRGNAMCALPTCPQHRDWPACVRIGEDEFAVTGGVAGAAISADAFAYHIKTGMWTALPPLPVGLSAHRALVADGRSFVLGRRPRLSVG